LAVDRSEASPLTLLKRDRGPNRLILRTTLALADAVGINRFQRITDDIAPKFDDSAPSIPVPFTSSTWGSLASFAARPYPVTKKWYGTSGNSFVAVIEFGDNEGVHRRSLWRPRRYAAGETTEPEVGETTF
jgi:hypothetical protein